MPAPGDHDARRRDVSEAVWRVLAARGFAGLTMRAVAAELGTSTGLVTHYFASKHELVRHALEIAADRELTRARNPQPGKGLAGLRAALLDVLPLTDELIVLNRVWVSSWDGALGDPQLGAMQAARYARWRAVLRWHVDDALHLGELPEGTDPDDVTARAAAFAHGLVLQALFDQDTFPPHRQRTLLDQFLRTLTP